MSAVKPPTAQEVVSTRRTPPLVYNVDEAAAILRISPRLARQILATGALHSFLINRRRLISRDALLQYIRARELAAGWEGPPARDSVQLKHRSPANLGETPS